MAAQSNNNATSQTTNNVSNSDQLTKPAKKKMWIYGIFLLFGLVVYLYFEHLSNIENRINRDFYRVLFEASNQFNNNVGKLRSMMEDKQSANAVRAVLPGFRIKKGGDKDCLSSGNSPQDAKNWKEKPLFVLSEPESYSPLIQKSFGLNNEPLILRKLNERLPTDGNKNYSSGEMNNAIDACKDSYYLKGNNIVVKRGASDYATIKVDTLIPKPSSGFSLYVLADQEGKVLSQFGEEKRLSMTNLNEITKALNKKHKGFSLNLSRSTKTEPKAEPKMLPSTSEHVDMKISYGNFRVFVFPFQLESVLGKLTEKSGSGIQENGGDPSEHSKTKSKEVTSLYLVGILPKHIVDKASVGKWNIPLLIVTIVVTAALFLILQLVLTPHSTALSRTLVYSITITSSLLLFLLASYILSSFQTNNRVDEQNQRLVEYLDHINNALTHDVLVSFDELARHEEVYKDLYAWVSRNKDVDCKGESNFWSINSDIVLRDSHLYMNAKTVETTDYWGKTECFYKRLKNVFNVKATELPSGILIPNNMKYELESKKNSDDANEEEFSGIVNTYYADEDLNNNYNIGVSNNILSVFLMQREGHLFLPSIRYREYNAAPSTVNLSFRKYFKDVFDRRGLDLIDRSGHFNQHNYQDYSLTVNNSTPYFPASLDGEISGSSDIEFKTPIHRNVVIQRLHNKHNGTRGITISKLLEINNWNSRGLAEYSLVTNANISSFGGDINERYSEDIKRHYKKHGPFVIAADVQFNRLNIRLNDTEQTRQFMVINRHTGDVVFHSDEQRVLVDNLFQNNIKNKELVSFVQSNTLSRKRHKPNEIHQGFFHGDRMFFAIDNTIYPDWVVVAYYPKSVIKSFNDVQYVLMISLMVIPLLLVFIFWGITYLRRKLLKQDVGNFQHSKSTAWRLIQFVTITVVCALLIVVYSYEFYLIENHQISTTLLTWLITSVPFSIAVIKLADSTFAREIRKIKGTSFVYRFIRKITRRDLKAKTICVRLPIFVACLGFFGIALLNINLWDYRLQQYYQAVESAESNREREELNRQGRELYLNSISRYGHSVDRLILKKTGDEGAQDSSNPKLFPDYVPNLSSLEGIIYIWKTFYDHRLLNDDASAEFAGISQSDSVSYWNVFWSTLFFILLLAVWYVFGRDFLYPRLYLIQDQLDLLKSLSDKSKLPLSTASSKAKITYFEPVENSGFIEISRFTGSQQRPSAHVGMHAALSNLSMLLNESNIAYEELQNVKIAFKHASLGSKYLDIFDAKQFNDVIISTADVEVVISGIESAINDKQQRKILLALFTLLNSFADEGVIAKFTILANEHTFKCVDTKSNYVHDDESSLSRDEYLAWSRLLMNFSVEISLTNFKEVADLQTKIMDDLGPFNIPLKLIDESSGDGEKCGDAKRLCLLVAEPHYRYYWEMCNNDEKLALYYLAKNGSFNSRNMHVLESLALNGLIKIDPKMGRIDLVNKSFKQFVINAEPKKILDALIVKGQDGAWKEHRLPIGLIIVLIVGGIALTSGESFYLIAVTLSGVLTTIVSISNSTNVLRGIGPG